MTKAQQDLYTTTVKRLARLGANDPTAQIIALAEEIERYRNKIQAMEGLLDEPAKIVAFPGTRYTHYDSDLGMYVVPCLYKTNGEQITFKFMTLTEERVQEGRIITTPAIHLAFGEVIDRLAELENKEESHGTPA